MTSLPCSVGATEWACVLCGCHIENDSATRATNLHWILFNLEHSSMEIIQMIQTAFRNECRDATQQKWPQLWANGDWQLHQDNVPVRASCLMKSFLVKHQIIKVTQTLCSPYLVPCDFWLFPKLKSPLKGKRFQTISEIQENTMGQLMAIPTKDFAECFEH